LDVDAWGVRRCRGVQFRFAESDSSGRRAPPTAGLGGAVGIAGSGWVKAVARTPGARFWGQGMAFYERRGRPGRMLTSAAPDGTRGYPRGGSLGQAP